MRKNTLLILVAILLVGGSFLVAEYRNKQAEKIYIAKDVVASNNSTSNPQEIDTDSDGIMDWEEILVGSDPNDPKSKPSTQKTTTTSDLTKKPVQEKLDPIDQVSRDFFARYMELRQLGQENDKATQQDLAQRTAGNIVLSEPAKYTLKEIVTKADTGNDGVRLYGQQITAIFKKYAIQSRSEGLIVKDADDQENPDILKEIDPIIVSYKNIINALIKVPAPKSIAPLHLDLVNSMNGSLFVAQSLRNSIVNPIEGVQGVVYYEMVAKNLFSAMNAIRSYFKYLGINETIF